MSARLIQVIECCITRGEGTGQDPIRNVTEYWSTEGELLAERDLWAESRPETKPPETSKILEPEWIVNDLAELGVKVGPKFYFLYKGESYSGGGKWRPVYKREFGECCHPPDLKGLKEPNLYVGYRGEEESEWHVLPEDET